MTRLSTRATASALLALASAGAAMAQYKVTDADGKVSYTDRPPASAARVQSISPSGGTSAIDNLPYELRQITSRYPVTIYTAKGCGGCDAGRSLLRQRGIPFTEKTVNTNADVEALTRVEGSNDLPVLKIGSKQLKGFSDGSWSEYLDAAGYPRQSKLPPNWQGPQPTALAPSEPVKETTAKAAAPTAPTPVQNNGFRF